MSEPQSRNEAILQATIDGTEYTDPPQSRIEDLLLQLKEVIEEGGGGGQTYNDFTGATASTAGAHGLVPAPSAGNQDKFLKADGTWDTPSGGGGGSLPILYDERGNEHVIGEYISSNGTTKSVYRKIKAGELEGLVTGTAFTFYDTWTDIRCNPDNAFSGSTMWLPKQDSSAVDGYIGCSSSTPFIFHNAVVRFESLGKETLRNDIYIQGSVDGVNWFDVSNRLSTSEWAVIQQNIEFQSISNTQISHVRLYFSFNIAPTWTSGDYLAITGGSLKFYYTDTVYSKILYKGVSADGTFNIYDYIK